MSRRISLADRRAAADRARASRSGWAAPELRGQLA